MTAERALYATALVVLVVNDRVLKSAAPGVVTGKLSDAAGVVLAPLVLGRLGLSRRLAVTLTAAGFVAVKSWPAGATAFATVDGAAVWLAERALSAAGFAAAPHWNPVRVVCDRTDVAVAPFALVPLLVPGTR